MKKITISLLVLFNLIFSLNLQAQALETSKNFRKEVNLISNMDELFKLARSTKDNKQLEQHVVVVERIVELQPSNPNLKFALAKAYALVDDKTSSYNILVEMQNAGLSYPTAGHDEFKNIHGTPVYDYIEEGMVNNGQPFGVGQVVGKISENYSGMLFENIAYDAKGERLLMASVRSGAVYELDKNNKLNEVIAPSNPASGPWGGVDLVVDADNDVLWVSSATMPQYTGTSQENFGQSMITKYKLSTLEAVNAFALKDPKDPLLFSALHLSASGNLYFANLFNNQIFKVAKDADSIESLVSLNKVNALKAITTNTDESILYFSDYDHGVFAMNLASGKMGKIGGNRANYSTGFDDIFYHEGDLVGIQNGLNPARIMRLRLNEDVLLENMYAIEAGREEFKGLSKGVINGSDIFYIANSQWDKMELNGLLSDGKKWDDVVIMKSDVKYKLDEQIANKRKMEEIKKRRGLN